MLQPAKASTLKAFVPIAIAAAWSLVTPKSAKAINPYIYTFDLGPESISGLPQNIQTACLAGGTSCAIGRNGSEYMLAKGSFTLNFTQTGGGVIVPFVTDGEITLAFYNPSLSDGRTFYTFPASDTSGLPDLNVDNPDTGRQPKGFNITSTSLPGIYTLAFQAGESNQGVALYRLFWTFGGDSDVDSSDDFVLDSSGSINSGFLPLDNANGYGLGGTNEGCQNLGSSNTPCQGGGVRFPFLQTYGGLNGREVPTPLSALALTPIGLLLKLRRRYIKIINI